MYVLETIQIFVFAFAIMNIPTFSKIRIGMLPTKYFWILFIKLHMLISWANGVREYYSNFIY